MQKMSRLSSERVQRNQPSSEFVVFLQQSQPQGNAFEYRKGGAVKGDNLGVDFQQPLVNVLTLGGNADHFCLRHIQEPAGQARADGPEDSDLEARCRHRPLTLDAMRVLIGGREASG
jgi:hypothetical protein